MNRSVFVPVSIATILLCLPLARADVNVGDSPSFELTALDGQPLKLADYKGKIVLVDFWATWCIPCIEQADHMVAVRKQYGERGLQIIGVTLDKSAKKLNAFITEKGFDWPQFFDPKSRRNSLAGEWGADNIPRTYLLDPTGKVVWIGKPNDMDAALEKAFKETPPIVLDPAIVTTAKEAIAFVDANVDSDPIAALKKFVAVPADAMKDPALASKLGGARKKLIAAGDNLKAACETLVENKDFAAAIAQLNEIATALPKTDLADAATKRAAEIAKLPEAIAQAKTAQLAKKAADLLATAETFKAQKKPEQAYAAYKSVVKQYPNTDAAKTAADAIAVYEQDPTFAKHAGASETDAKAKSMLSLANSYRTAGDLDAARAKFKEIIATFPKSSYASMAQTAINEMK